MNWSTARTMLRRRLNVAGTDNTWTDAELLDLFNEGLRKIQDEVIKVVPSAVVYTYVTDAVSGQRDYQKPAGMRMERALLIKTTATGTYLPVTSGRARDIQRTGLIGASVQPDSLKSGYEYTHHGQYFRFAPAPSFSLVDAIKVESIPTIAVAVDTDVPDLDINLHLAAVYAAQLITGGEAGDSFKEAQEQLALMIGNIPIYYRQSLDQQEQVSPLGLEKSY